MESVSFKACLFQNKTVIETSVRAIPKQWVTETWIINGVTGWPTRNRKMNRARILGERAEAHRELMKTLEPKRSRGGRDPTYLSLRPQNADT